jgi:hypothetical protein
LAIGAASGSQNSDAKDSTDTLVTTLVHSKEHTEASKLDLEHTVHEHMFVSVLVFRGVSTWGIITSTNLAAKTQTLSSFEPLGIILYTSSHGLGVLP